MFRKKGFTLLELIIVIIVIGILASIALPRYVKITERARLAEARQMLSSIRDSQLRYFTQWSNFTTCATALDISNSTGLIPGGKYFSYPTPAGGDWSQTNLDSQRCVVGVANRTTTDTIYPNYNITIFANGTFNSTDATNVTPML